MTSNIFKIALLFILAIMLSSFFDFFSFSSVPKSTKMAFKICREISKEIERRHNLKLVGISEEGDKDKYSQIGLSLASNRLLDKDEGALVLMEIVDYALETFNSRSDFRPYMVEYPFTGDNIIVSIYIETYPKEPYHPEIAVFTFLLGNIYYKTNSKDLPYKYFSKEKEPIEDAKKRLNYVPVPYENIQTGEGSGEIRKRRKEAFTSRPHRLF